MNFSPSWGKRSVNFSPSWGKRAMSARPLLAEEAMGGAAEMEEVTCEARRAVVELLAQRLKVTSYWAPDRVGKKILQKYLLPPEIWN